MNIEDLDNLIKTVCPIDGVNSDGVVFFKAEATGEQRSAAQKIMDENLPLLDKE